MRDAPYEMQLLIVSDRQSPAATAVEMASRQREISVNFRYYEPRTAHGSSLSPALYALVAARLGSCASLFPPSCRDRLGQQHG